ncbi:unnamed protein product, partial [Hapterophycus canaliculatus]
RPPKGGDIFFTELFKVEEDGSVSWESDGGVSGYNPTAYERQHLSIPSGSSGRY